MIKIYAPTIPDINEKIYLIDYLDDNIIKLIKTETGKSFKVILTGGFSDLYKNSIKTKVIQDRDLTIKGLIKISKLII